jgi:hypothetical protein
VLWTSVPSSCAQLAPLQSGTIDTTASPPPGRNTRRISDSARGWSNQWNASATVTASTDASPSGMTSANPSRTRSAPIFATSNSRSEWLDRHDVESGNQQRARQLPGSRRQVEHRRTGSKPKLGSERAHHGGRIVGPSALIRIGHRGEPLCQRMK